MYQRTAYPFHAEKTRALRFRLGQFVASRVVLDFRNVKF